MAKALQKPKPQGLSERTKLSLLIGCTCVLVIGGAWWAYFRFTTIPPPDLKTATPADMVAFLGNERAVGRMPVNQRQEYLTQAYQRFGDGPSRDVFIQSLNRMSSSEKQVLFDAVFEIMHTRVTEMAKEYNALPVADRGAFVDNAIQKIEDMRGELGGGSPSKSVGEPMKASLPTGSDEWSKILVSRTSGQDRAEAKPFVDRMAARYKEKQSLAKKSN